MPASKWHSLTQEQKTAIIEAREKAGIKRKTAAVNGGGEGEEAKEDKEDKKQKAAGVGDQMTRRR
jgi:hypothetical protein